MNPYPSPIQLHRPPPAVPLRRENNDQIAYFFHPGYLPPHDLLFTLPCVDPSDSGQPTNGLHYHTALVACQIIGNNAFDTGRLFFDRKGKHAVSDMIPPDGVLRPGRYFFIVNFDPTYRYPIVPSFRDWQFPHDYIVDAWPSLKRDDPPVDDRPRCALTNHDYGLKKAYIVPREEGEWFMQNSMSRYGVDMHNVNDSSNILRLRADIHRCFDARKFSMVPKASSSSRGMAYVVHVFQANMGDFSSLYNNMRLQYLGHISREFIFSRFAWTILMLVKPFLLVGTPRSVVRCQINQGIMEWKAEDWSSPRLSSFYGGGGTRSASLKKQKRQREEYGEEGGSLADSDEWASDEDGGGPKRVRLQNHGGDEILDVPLLFDLIGKQYGAPYEVHSWQYEDVRGD